MTINCSKRICRFLKRNEFKKKYICLKKEREENEMNLIFCKSAIKAEEKKENKIKVYM